MSLYKKLFSPFYTIMENYVAANKRWTFDRVERGHNLTEETLEEVKQFRLACYMQDAPYLVPVDEAQILKERNFDLNSYHIIARNLEGQIVGTLRLLQRPFEMEELGLPEEARAGLDQYLEISRLVCSDRKNGLGRRLLIRAGLWSIQQTTFKGFTAVCKCHRLPMFKRFGLSPLSSFTLKERNDQRYHLIRADFSHITAITFVAFMALKLQFLLLKKPIL